MKFKLPKYDGYSVTNYVAGRLEEYIPNDRIAEFNEAIEKEFDANVRLLEDCDNKPTQEEYQKLFEEIAEEISYDFLIDAGFKKSDVYESETYVSYEGKGESWAKGIDPSKIIIEE